MKKIRILLVLLACLFLSGCGESAPQEIKKEPPTEAETTPPPVEEVFSYVVTTEVREDSARTEDGTVLATCRFVLPVLSVQRQDGSFVTAAATPEEEKALKTVDAFNKNFAQWSPAEEVRKIAEWARKDLEWQEKEIGLDWLVPYVLELDCTVYQTERLVSVAGLYYTYTGGAHPNTELLGWNFDLEEGVFFEPELLSDDPTLQSAVGEEIIRQASLPREDGYAPIEMYLGDYTTNISNWSSYAVSFNQEGMTVIFSPYALAPYAEGAQEFHISNEFLKPYLNETGRALLGLNAE